MTNDSKKVLFIDRDGTILVEPMPSEQVDSFDKMDFVEGAISALKSIASMDYELVLASNQDGLGTASFPYEDYIGPHSLMQRILASEGIHFADELIDPTFPADNAPTRKPGIGMFTKYLSGDYDLAESYVIGDRATDVQLAKNLGCKSILLDVEGTVQNVDATFVARSWAEVAEYLRRGSRVATVVRNTRETKISVTVDLDGRLESSVSTGLKFFDHMLEQIVHHGGVSLQLSAVGDLEVDEHHTMEDVGIALGTAIGKALGNKAGIARYGFALPMDECDAIVVMDLGGRIDFAWDVNFTREYVGDTPTEMFKHFFGSLAAAMQCNLHIKARGENNHHLAEAVFKAFARCLRSAVAYIPFNYDLPSSKGLL
ncbi:MAG: bifunctional histidinol-phosphatase/imidazoleglycerol-phosphate dehydratase HisB [Bacteroidales bacterium]|nr:bifunctional histidinol-phosphatase/imidazoleglycerol-phosphate dehydratase HisB [Bacteroidales bacterium]